MLPGFQRNAIERIAIALLDIYWRLRRVGSPAMAQFACPLCMDRLPFASEGGCCRRKSLICIRPHMRASSSSHFFIADSPITRERVIDVVRFSLRPRRSSR
jgi:hypothetical protein